jgi:hypothetical protein
MEKGLVLLLVVAMAGCGGHADAPATEAPAPTRYEVDAVSYPEQLAEDADDLNGDGVADNRFAVIVGALFPNGEATAAARQAIASGALAASLDVNGEALAWQDLGTEPGTVHGAWNKSVFASDVARKSAEPARGAVHVVLFGQPIELPLVGLEITLHSDDTGYAGEIHGAIAKADIDQRVLPQVYSAIQKMLAANPGAHGDLVRLLDTDHDGTVTLTDLSTNPFVHDVVAPDVQLFDPSGGWAPSPRNTTPDALSVGFAFHARMALR